MGQQRHPIVVQPAGAAAHHLAHNKTPASMQPASARAPCRAMASPCSACSKNDNNPLVADRALLIASAAPQSRTRCIQNELECVRASIYGAKAGQRRTHCAAVNPPGFFMVRCSGSALYIVWAAAAAASAAAVTVVLPAAPSQTRPPPQPVAARCPAAHHLRPSPPGLSFTTLLMSSSLAGWSAPPPCTTVNASVLR